MTNSGGSFRVRGQPLLCFSLCCLQARRAARNRTRHMGLGQGPRAGTSPHWCQRPGRAPRALRAPQVGLAPRTPGGHGRHLRMSFQPASPRPPGRPIRPAADLAPGCARGQRQPALPPAPIRLPSSPTHLPSPRPPPPPGTPVLPGPPAAPSPPPPLCLVVGATTGRGQDVVLTQRVCTTWATGNHIYAAGSSVRTVALHSVPVIPAAGGAVPAAGGADRARHPAENPHRRAT